MLVIGAGAVGQVYGRHAHLGGASVTFFVRDKYRETVSRGFDMYPLNRRNKTEAVRFDAFETISQIDEVASRTFDQVYLTVSSPALRGPWLGELVRAIGTSTTLVALQPGQDDLEVILAAGASREQVVSGVITLISYAAPLPGETRFSSPGMAYWFPPLAPSRVSGSEPRVRAVVELLEAGGLPAKRHPDVPRFAAFPTAMLMPFLVALEGVGWKLAALRGDRMRLGAKGVREAFAVVGLDAGTPPLGARLAARPRMLRIALWFGRRIVPLPLETYLREHFTKVGDQTRLYMAGYIARGHEASVDVTALESLMKALPPGDV